MSDADTSKEFRERFGEVRLGFGREETRHPHRRAATIIVLQHETGITHRLKFLIVLARQSRRYVDTHDTFTR